MTNPLPTSGRMSLSQVAGNLELPPGRLSMGAELLRALAGNRGGAISLSDFYGANELECYIRAEEDDNGNAVGFYSGFWGENDSPALGNVVMSGVFDSFDIPGHKFVFAVEGAQTADAFRALVMNNKIYYQGDEDVFNYDAGSNTTVWEWFNQPAGLDAGTTYELSMLIGPSSTSAPADPVGVLPLGGGRNWQLVFEDNFDAATLDSDKWNDALWYLRNDAEKNPPHIKNYDLNNGKLRIWPAQANAIWVQRSITTFSKFDQAQGWWETSVKVPQNKGCRVSFWLMNHDTSARPIISGFETFTSHNLDSGWVDANNKARDFSVSIQPSTDGQVLLSRRYLAIEGNNPLPLTDEFHTIGIYKDETHVRFYINGREWRSQEITGPNAMTLRQYVVVSLDYNNDSGGPTGSTVQNATKAVEFDYVRAWRRPAGGGPPDPVDPDPVDPDPVDPTDPDPGDPVVVPPSSSSRYVTPFNQSQANFPYMTFREEFDDGYPIYQNWPLNFDRGTSKSGGQLQAWASGQVLNGLRFMRMATGPVFAQRYGYFEVKCKSPMSRIDVGFLLSSPDGQSDGGFVQILKTGYYGDGPITDYTSFGNTVQVRDNKSAVQSHTRKIPSIGSPNMTLWHTLGVWWTDTEIIFFFDGIRHVSVPTSQWQFLNKACQLELSMHFNMGASASDITQGPSNSFLVDYVRVWASAGSTTIGTYPPLTPVEGGVGHQFIVGGYQQVMFVGNSTTWGYRSNVGTRVATPYPAAFAYRRGEYVVQNLGVNSSQVNHWISGTGGVPQTWEVLMASSPTIKYVVMDFGTLEQFDMTPGQFKTHLKTMITEVKKVSGRIPVLVTPFIADFASLASYAQAIRDTGSETGVVVIDKYKWSRDLVIASGQGVRAFVPDGVHPNEQLYIDGGHFVAHEWYKVTGAAAPPPFIPITPPDPDATPANFVATPPYKEWVDFPGTIIGVAPVVPPPAPTTPMPAVPSGHPHRYELVFNEEFDGSDLNYNIWNNRIWWNPDEDAGAKNWQVSGGQLHIWPQRSADGKWRYRTIDTDGKYYQTRGFFECEAKLCKGRGTWPAFWLYNHDGNLRPEIDIMEAYSGGGPDTGQTWANSRLEPIDFAATLWKADGDKIGDIRMSQVMPHVILSNAYYKYGCLWETDGVTFYFDGKQMGPKMMTNFFTMRMYILLDVYLGSASGTPNTSETPQGISNSFSVKYVRTWRKL